MARILVTGGTGTLGRALVPLLLEDGHTVRILSRRPAPAGLEPGLQWASGDLATGGGLAVAVAGMEVVVHAATSPRRQPREVDAAGTRRLVGALEAAGSGARLVFPSVVGADRIGRGYYRHKQAAEEAVSRSALPWTILRATRFHESLDRYLASLLRFPVGFLPRDLRFQPLDPAELAERLRRAVATGETGRLDDFGGPEVRTIEDLAEAWLAARGARKRIVRLPLGGSLAGGIRAGYETAPDHREGTVTWERYLQHRTAAGASV